MNAQELNHELPSFTGSEVMYRSHINNLMTYTQGVQFLAENAGGGCYWLLDIIGTELMQIQSNKEEEFIELVITVKDDKADLAANDGNGASLWDRHIDFTDFPEGVWKLWLVSGTLLLPSEY
jgi:hypothetical protein